MLPESLKSTGTVEASWLDAPSSLGIVDSAGTVLQANALLCEDLGLDRPARGPFSLAADLTPGDFRALVEGAGSPVPISGVRADLTTFRRYARCSPIDDTTYMVGFSPADAGLGSANFTHALGHDIRGRLRGSVGLLDLVTGRANADSRTGEFLDRARRAVTVADEMLDQIRRLVELVNAEATLQPVEMNRLLERVGEEGENPLQLTIDDCLPCVLTDPRQMSFIVTELLDNARRHSDQQRPAMSVTATARGRWTTLHFSDNARPIPSDFADAIFFPFRQLQQRNWTEGTGMGLTLCRAIVQSHAGRVGVRPRPDGNTIDITLAMPKESVR